MRWLCLPSRDWQMPPDWHIMARDVSSIDNAQWRGRAYCRAPLMKLITPTLLTFALVPCTFAFILTLMPARLYAEGGVGPSACDPAAIQACADAGASGSCSLDGSPGACLTTLSVEDAGRITGNIQCSLKSVPAPSGSTVPPLPTSSGSTPSPAPSGSTPPPASSTAAKPTSADTAEAGGCSIGAPLDLGGALSGIAILSVLGAVLGRRRARAK